MPCDWTSEESRPSLRGDSKGLSPPGTAVQRPWGQKNIEGTWVGVRFGTGWGNGSQEAESSPSPFRECSEGSISPGVDIQIHSLHIGVWG